MLQLSIVEEVSISLGSGGRDVESRRETGNLGFLRGRGEKQRHISIFICPANREKDLCKPLEQSTNSS